MKRITAFFIIASMLTMTSCMENYSNGERVGTISKFAKSGLMFKSWEGELHVTQTGMNSTMNEFDFSMDNNNENPKTIATLDSAAKDGWKVRVVYHQCRNKNMTGSRGDSNYFIDSVQVMDRNFNTMFNNNSTKTASTTGDRPGHIIDTIYLVIDKSH